MLIITKILSFTYKHGIEIRFLISFINSVLLECVLMFSKEEQSYRDRFFVFNEQILPGLHYTLRQIFNVLIQAQFTKMFL